jgi:hypothetical protein
MQMALAVEDLLNTGPVRGKQVFLFPAKYIGYCCQGIRQSPQEVASNYR